jgi:hypothetical protein
VLLQSCSHIHAIAVNVGFRDYDISKVYCDTQGDRRRPPAALDLSGWDQSLDVLCPFDRVKSAGKLGEDTITGQFDQPATILRDPGTNYLVEYFHPAEVRMTFIAGHQGGVADDVQEYDGCQPPADTDFLGVFVM